MSASGVKGTFAKRVQRRNLSGGVRLTPYTHRQMMAAMKQLLAAGLGVFAYLGLKAALPGMGIEWDSARWVVLTLLLLLLIGSISRRHMKKIR